MGCCVCVSAMYWVFVLLVEWYVLVFVCMGGGVLVMLVCGRFWFGCCLGVCTSRKLEFAGTISVGDVVGNEFICGYP